MLLGFGLYGDPGRLTSLTVLAQDSIQSLINEVIRRTYCAQLRPIGPRSL